MTPDTDGESSLPDDAAHVIVVCRDHFAPAPDDHPADHRTYKQGDELPFDVGATALPEHPRTLAAIDEDGAVVAGGARDPDRQPWRRSSTSRDSSPTRDERIEAALERWRSGEGFDPSDYATDEGA